MVVTSVLIDGKAENVHTTMVVAYTRVWVRDIFGR